MSAMGAASTPALGWKWHCWLLFLGKVGWAYLTAAEADCDDA
jgi:hypothetical protein